jgi:hypothetical protein
MESILPLIPIGDLEKIILCLNLCRSDKDHEVLAAVRGVNRIMARLDLTWSKVFAEIIERTKHELKSQKPTELTIDDALARLLKVLKPGSFRDLILDYKAQWLSKGRLSDKQRDVIWKSLKTHGIAL